VPKLQLKFLQFLCRTNEHTHTQCSSGSWGCESGISPTEEKNQRLCWIVCGSEKADDTNRNGSLLRHTKVGGRRTRRVVSNKTENDSKRRTTTPRPERSQPPLTNYKIVLCCCLKMEAKRSCLNFQIPFFLYRSLSRLRPHRTCFHYAPPQRI